MFDVSLIEGDIFGVVREEGFIYHIKACTSKTMNGALCSTTLFDVED